MRRASVALRVPLRSAVALAPPRASRFHCMAVSDGLSVPALKDALRARGLRVSGLKSELISRLEAAEGTATAAAPFVNPSLRAAAAAGTRAASTTPAKEGPLGAFADLAIEPVLKKNIAAMGITTMTPVQAETLGPLLAGKDVLARAQTGTGKTLAFLVPSLQTLLANNAGASKESIGVLVLSPTRELAIQIRDNAKKLAEGSGLVVHSVREQTRDNIYISIYLYIYVYRVVQSAARASAQQQLSGGRYIYICT